MIENKKFDLEIDEDNDENAIGGSLAAPQKLTIVDYIIAGALGVFSAFIVWALSYKGLHPTAWFDCAVAAGLRPAETIAPGLWRIIAGAIFKVAGVSGGMVAIGILGKVVIGAIVAMAYLSFKEILAILVRISDTRKFWTLVLSRAVCILASILFLCSDPVWTLGYAFTAVQFEVFLFALGVCLLSRFLSGGSVKPVYYAMFTMGLLCAESPLGLISMIVFWFIFYILLTKGSLFHVKLLQPLMQQSSKWYLTFFWGMGLLIGIAVNVIGFVAFDGMSNAGMSFSEVPIRYVTCLWQALVNAATAGGWIVGIGFAAMPFVLGVALLRRATDIEYFLSYHVGIVFFVIGTLAYSQMSAIRPLWFWTLSDKTAVNSPLLLFLCALMMATVVLCALTVALVDVFCRDHRRLAAQYDPELDDASFEISPIGKILRLSAFAAVAALLLGGTFPGRIQNRTEEMLALMKDYVNEVVTEAGDAKLIFTDGCGFDCAFELESTKRGGNLRCISIQPSEHSRSGETLRALMEDDEDKLCAEVGGANILRTWQRDKPARLDNCAMQLGLELWKRRAGLDYPPVSGVLAKTKWNDDKDRADGITRAYALAERILKIYADKGPAKIAGTTVNELFLFMQWRLARLARIRAELFDRAGKTEDAKEELKIAETLDDKNDSLKRILEKMSRLRAYTMRQMTPREGLQFALVRADFPLARRYAEPILDADPDDPSANFAMGMDYLMQEQYNRSEEFLRRSLIRSPTQPAIWNNIAVLQYRQGRYDEAKENALKALELLPNSAEVKDTLQKIEDALAGKLPQKTEDRKSRRRNRERSEDK